MANGLDGSYIFNNRLICGAHGNASEIGELPPELEIRPGVRSLSYLLNVEFGSLKYEDIESMCMNREGRFMQWLDKAIRTRGEVQCESDSV